ncbi:VOC family protein [Pontixanthobacter aquaemixtae]|uniref:VOC family protein n=1 Tax=Pontixanthobacter aquaemixtae TaxID=1958940 RepID=A0A844ZNF7_9SPHN|nr:VOC family protein [Pontixanthobacter aquaemixtae]MXO89223.1 VOC family protein [Pontixanthobacter aquaemixtae]
MFSHVMLGADDLDAAKKFYDACFTAIGGREGIVDPGGRIMYLHNGGVFMVTKPIDGEAASCGNGSTIGFAVESTEQADAWHKAGAANGGTEIEDPPGIREGAGMKLYLAYLRDPAGNKVCTMMRV